MNAITKIDFFKKFQDDLIDGQVGEKTIVEFLLKKDKKFQFVTFNNDKLYDFILDRDGKDIKFECKTDCYEHFKGYNTNNIFIEVRHKGNPSGVMVTEADFFVYYFPFHEKVYFIKTKELKRLLIENQGLFIRKELSGDEGRVTGYTINRFEAEEYFKVFSIELPDYFQKFL